MQLRRIYTYRKPEVVIFVRHAATCPHRELETYTRCDCVKWLRWSNRGKQYRQSAGCRSWSQAEEKRAALQTQLDAGETATPAVQPEANTLTGAIQTYLLGKESEVRSETFRKLRHQLGLLDEFMSHRSRFFVKDITKEDVIAFRATWKWGDLSKIVAQTLLKSFLRSVERDDLAKALGSLKQSREGRERRKPKPLTEAEIQRILAHISDNKFATMVRLMVSTGLAIADAVQLERKNITDGWLRIERQKTGRSVRQKLDAGLHRELMAVLNGNPRYVFWSGDTLSESERGLLRIKMTAVMKAADCYIPGGVFHRFRDTAVDTWLGLGWSLTDVAAALGDTLAVTEKHYADLASKRMESRLEKLPTRTWVTC
jgi:integrase